jgi:NAD(P)-dependent dehydrogenase (short-subunit alcohol dehydrogenase family)
MTPDQFPKFELTNQIALVTGAARGLGRAISLALAAAGVHVALGLRDVNADAGLRAEIQSLGRESLPLQMDVNSLGEINQAVSRTVAHFGRIDILVNNVGIAPGNLA